MMILTTPQRRKANKKSGNLLVVLFVLGTGSILGLQFLAAKMISLSREITTTIPASPPPITKNLPDCRVLISNVNVDFHYETLESALALYPLPRRHNCNHFSMKFTIAVSNGRGNPAYRRKSASWNDYAQDQVMKKDYSELVTPGQSRRLVEVIAAEKPLENQHDFDYIIDTSCYCDGRFSNRIWLFAKDSHFCVFHTTCEFDQLEAEAPNRSRWLNPMLPHSYFPSFLPQFHHSRELDLSMHHLCVIGQVSRRNYDFVDYYLKHRSTGMRFHNFGWGKRPEIFDGREEMFQFHVIPEFVKYQHDLYETCDAILSLLTRVNQSQYFEGKTQLSGALVQASTYQKPIVLHQDLAYGYREHLVNVQTHSDNPDSFVDAMEQLWIRLDEVKSKAS